MTKTIQMMMKIKNQRKSQVLKSLLVAKEQMDNKNVNSSEKRSIINRVLKLNYKEGIFC